MFFISLKSLDMRLDELRKLSDDIILERYNKSASERSQNSFFFEKEILRRENERQINTMLRYTRYVAWMTLIMTLATLINVWIAFKLSD